MTIHGAARDDRHARKRFKHVSELAKFGAEYATRRRSAG